MSGYHLSPVPIWPQGAMPAKPGKNRRGPTAAEASAGERERGKEKEEGKKERNVSNYLVAFGNHIHILRTLSLIFIFLFLLYMAS